MAPFAEKRWWKSEERANLEWKITASEKPQVTKKSNKYTGNGVKKKRKAKGENVYSSEVVI